MTTDQLNDLAGTILGLATIPATLNVIIYGFGSPWWTSWLGRVMFAKWLSVALVFWFVVARRTLGDFLGYEWWAIAIYSFTFLTFVATTVELIIERRPPDSNLVGKELRMSTPVTGAEVPEIWYKAQRVIRTVFATLVSVLTVWAGFALIAPQILAELANVLPESWVAWLAGVIGSITVVAGVITRILAIPSVNDFLTKVGMGSVPKKALTVVQEVKPSGRVVTVTEVIPDPKVEDVPIPPPVSGGAVG